MSRKIVPAILFIATLFSIDSRAQEGEITLEKIWRQGSFYPQSVSGIESMKDGKHYTSLVSENSNQYVVKYAYKTGNAVDTLLRSSQLKNDSGKPVRFSEYSFNPDESKLLLASDQESIYRRSSKANYYAFDLKSEDFEPITDFSKGKQQLAAFSPAANMVGFVRDNDLYISDLDKDKETRVTADGKWGQIINGAVDWVYEEEFAYHRGFYWSPEGTKIAFYKFDESEVPEFGLTYYNDLYPEKYDFKYPKAGETNSTVQVLVYNLDDNAKTEIDLGMATEQYLPRIKWTQDDDKVCIMRMNRHQSHLEFLLADLKKSDKGMVPVKNIYSEKAETYIEINDNLIFLKDGKHFIWNSEKDGWNHIYMYNLKGEEVAQLTQGDWEVIEFYGVDQEDNRIFFSASIENSIEQEIYSKDFSALMKKAKKGETGLSPEGNNSNTLKRLTPNNNTNEAYFSETFDYFINFESAAQKPYFIILRNSEGDIIRKLETNEALQKTVDNLDISPKEFGTYETAMGHSLNYWMIKPPNFDPEKKYPAIFMIYGGPGSNTVQDSWGGSNYFWHQMLAQDGYVIISVDPRGTMRRGRKFKHSTYLQLGKLETEDFIDAAKHFGGKPFIDKERIGMMGWSYGGYMTSLAMTKGAEYFDTGIAVAPVTNWRYYDTIYTERFMRTPQENASGYDDNSPINHVEKMKGNYLLVHGGADDNVHPQNTMEMISALVEADKQFDLFIYPNKNHGIYGGNTRYHLYTKMTNFIKENL